MWLYFGRATRISRLWVFDVWERRQRWPSRAGALCPHQWQTGGVPLLFLYTCLILLSIQEKSTCPYSHLSFIHPWIHSSFYLSFIHTSILHNSHFHPFIIPSIHLSILLKVLLKLHCERYKKFSQVHIRAMDLYTASYSQYKKTSMSLSQNLHFLCSQVFINFL